MTNFNYILIDAAKAGGAIHEAMRRNHNFLSLYKNREEEELESVAPFLFGISKDTSFQHWYLRFGWEENWGILMHSKASFQDVYNHFWKFIQIKTEEGQEVYFRFYDPRVLRIFLPTCDADQLKDFFGPVEQFICVDEDPEFGLVFSFQNGRLTTHQMTVQEIFSEIPPLQSENGKMEPEKDWKIISKSEYPLEYTLFEGDAEMFETYLNQLSNVEVENLFLNSVHFYTLLPSQNFRLFFLDQEGKPKSSEVSGEEMKTFLENEKLNRRNRELALEDKIRNRKQKQNSSPEQSLTQSSGNSIWSWLKI